MPVSSDSLRIAIVAEATPGTTPATPTWETVRATGEGLTFEHETTLSAEMGGGSRGVKDSILAGGQVNGAINFEVSKNDALEALLAAALGSAWGFDTGYATTPTAEEVFDYDTLTTFTVEKRWKLDNVPTYSYHRYTGCLPNSLNLSITPNEPITGSIGFIGNARVIDTGEVASSTYNAAGTVAVMTAPLVTGINLYAYGGWASPLAWVTAACFTSLNLSVDNGSRGIACIGTLGNKETVLGKFNVQPSGSIYYAADDPLTGMEAQTEYGLQVTMTDSAANSYRLRFPRVKFATAGVVAGGQDTDVLTDFTMQALVDGSPANVMQILRA